MLLNIASLVLGTIHTTLDHWHKHRQVKLKGKLKLETAKMNARIAHAKQQQIHESQWDNIALKQLNTSWKDEFLLLILSYPIIGSFIPTLQDSVATGWNYVAQAPQWYQFALLGVIASSFGLRWLVQPLLKR